MTLHLAEMRLPWRLSPKLVISPDITRVPLPPNYPALNPTENVWQFMRGNRLSNRIFRSGDDAWNKLVHQPSRSMCLGLRDSGSETGHISSDHEILVSERDEIHHVLPDWK